MTQPYSPKRSALGAKASSLALALSVALAAPLSVFAAPNGTNTVNDGQIIQGGNYFNTKGSETVFQNSAKTGLYLKGGDTVTAREVNGVGQLTGNGGNVHINAPGQVVRLDGNIDASGLIVNGVLGNGGHVKIDAGYLYQNGQIFLQGQHGGQANINVGAMTVGPNAGIFANSTGGGNGGVVTINSKGAVDIAKGAIIDTSGKVIGTYDTNVINIQGGLVNLDGVLKANGGAPGDSGGAVLVAANGKSQAMDLNAIQKTDFFKGDADAIAAATHTANLSKTMDGHIAIGPTGKVLAEGAAGFIGYNPTNGGDGGFIRLVANDGRVDNNGLVSVNGGDGGFNPDPAIGPVILAKEGNNCVWQQTSLGQNGGNGGHAGQVQIAFKENGFSNNGMITANGGKGGNGQEARADDAKATSHYSHGGDGGNGGNGGLVHLYGRPSDSSLANIQVNGGEGGKGGIAVPNKCHGACNGQPGIPGQPGEIIVTPPPETITPNTPLPPPYPKENTRIGDTLPGALGPLVNYNRSIFMARAPLPIIQKKPKPVIVPPPPPPPAKPKAVYHAPPKKPVKKRVPVRGYW